MFDIGFTELVLVGIVSLIVIGPERLPSAIRTATLWIGRAKRSFNQVKSEIEREINTDEIRRQLHNESILADLEQAKTKADKLVKDAKKNIDSINAEVNAEVNAVLKEEEKAANNSQKTSGPEESMPKILAKTPATELDPATLDEESEDDVPDAEPVTSPTETSPALPQSESQPEPVPDLYNNPGVGRVQIQGNSLRPSAPEQKDNAAPRKE